MDSIMWTSLPSNFKLGSVNKNSRTFRGKIRILFLLSPTTPLPSAGGFGQQLLSFAKGNESCQQPLTHAYALSRFRNTDPTIYLGLGW